MTVMRLGPISIDRGIRRVRVVGRVVSLTAAEFDLLAFLVEKQRRVATHEEMRARCSMPEPATRRSWSASTSIT